MIISTTNIVSCFFTLNFPLMIFIIFLAVSLSNGENANYAACSKKYSCGQIQNIGYPFWGDNRPKFCGVSDFKLSCKHNKTVMNVMQNGYIPSSVISINESSHTIVISSRNLLESCHSENMTLLASLNPRANPEIHLFYGCSSPCDSRPQSKNFTCTHDDGTNSTAYYFYNSSLSDTAKQCSCKSNVTIPVDKRWLDELISSPNASSILTDRKIEMLYTPNFRACSKCVESGGRCGSSEDPSSDQFVCYCPDGLQPLTRHDTEKKLKLLLGLGIGGAIFVLSAIIAICYCKKRKFGSSKLMTRSASLESSASELEKGSIYFGVPLFSYNELVAATHSFDQSNELGSGGFGTVFYGKLKDGREVAVKRLFEKSYRRVEQFLNEVKILTRLRHQNLVSLFGCTSEKCRELLLVYEYVNNGTVADHLYGKSSKTGLLSWHLRMRIAIETATALSYLHASDIIHRDVKTNNILLDSNFSVKVADFGLSRLFPMDVTHVSTAPQGTPGYLDPEYHLCYKLTNKSDVYSFGVVLIELISSLPAINMDRQKLEINLSHYAINRIQRCAFDELVDPQLGFALDFKVRRMTIAVAELAFQCLQHDKNFRPSMEEVLENLKKIESVDYEALQAEEMARYGGEEMVKMRRSIPPSPSPSEDDRAQLLNNHQLYLSSPISVVDKWVSQSTASNNSK